MNKRKIFRLKRDNRTIASRLKVLENKLESGSFTKKDLKNYRELAIKMGRNISKLYRYRTTINQQYALEQKRICDMQCYDKKMVLKEKSKGVFILVEDE